MASPRASRGDALVRLRDLLAGQPPRTLESLAAADLDRLADAIEHARTKHSEALNTAVEEAFGQVPALLRGAVRRVVLR